MKGELTGEGLVKLLEMFKSDAQDWAKRRDEAAADSRQYHFFREGVILLKTVIRELQEGFRPTFPHENNIEAIWAKLSGSATGRD
jgi:hypothetical protein